MAYLLTTGPLSTHTDHGGYKSYRHKMSPVGLTTYLFTTRPLPTQCGPREDDECTGEYLGTKRLRLLGNGLQSNQLYGEREVDISRLKACEICVDRYKSTAGGHSKEAEGDLTLRCVGCHCVPDQISFETF